MRGKKAVGLIIATVCMFMSGCVSDAEFEALKKRVDSMEGQLGSKNLIEVETKESAAGSTAEETTREIHMAEEYEELDKEKVRRDLEFYKGKKVQFYGKTRGVNSHSDGKTHITVNDVIRIITDYSSDKVPFRLLDEDFVTVYGMVDGVWGSYGDEDVYITCDYIEISGEIYDVR